MKYLIVALINAIYGIMLFLSISRDTPGLFLIISIASIITILGLVGFGLWLYDFITSVKEEKKESTLLKSWWQIAKGIDILLILGLLFRAFVLQPFMVDGNSMEPNFHDQEYLLVNQMTYRLRTPERGETIIFQFPKNPSEDYIKRIIGLPGETVEITEGKILINNQLLAESYLSEDEQTIANGGLTDFKEQLGLDEYFVMGDNRGHSSDSREWGAVPRKNIIGRAWLVVYPWQYRGLVKNPSINLEPAILSPETLLNYFNNLITSSSVVWGKFS